jgi:hypothetical protein
MNKIWRWILFGVVLLAIAAPFGVRFQAMRLMDKDPCGGLDYHEPPGDGFYEAVELASLASRVPGIGSDATDAAQARCVGNFGLACLELERKQGPAAQRKASCEQWDRYMAFLRFAGADPAAICEVCAAR